ncbi:tetratricopeptide repeat protein [Sphingomonas japonica]|uniref:Lipopolysaccharide biosynthesis regulator YciM n=1 Tax=Sphingomonas japonica TaxID=511662 RepID=A0ABX0TXE0_9SPHN|nr:hypothetical protein [Sphingomonas japonica]NIJ22525.1 lipopolysaccharide biosynthesis regulator YciM [Sphingomonas japonica]
MSFVSKIALAAMLSTGTVAVMLPIPAAAQDKKAQEEPPIEISEEFRAAIVPVQTAITAKDYATAEAGLATARPLAQNDQEKYFVAALGLGVAQSKNDYAGMARELDELIRNPKTPPADLANYTLVRGQIAYNAKDMAAAKTYLTRAQQLGATDPNLPLMLAQTNLSGGNVAAGAAEIEKAIAAKKAAGEPVPEDWYKVTVSRLYQANDKAGALTWLKRQLADYPTTANWRSTILVYREGVDASLDDGARIDLFRLMRSAGALANQSDYIEYADLAFRAGLPYESKAVIDEGLASGKLPRSSTATSLLAESNKSIKQEGSLSAQEAKAKSASDGRPASQLADAYLADGQNAKAAELYRLALQKGGAKTEEVNLRLGIAHARANQTAEAKQSFAAVASKPRADIASLWTTYLDNPPRAGSTAPAAATGS